MAWQDILRIRFRSSEGRTAWKEFLIAPAATTPQVAAFVAAVEAVTLAKVAYVTREKLVSEVSTDSGTPGSYQSHRDLLRLQVRHADATLTTPAIPCVKAAVLDETGRGLDKALQEVADLQDAMAAIVVSDSGSPAEEILLGFRDYVRKF